MKKVTIVGMGLSARDVTAEQLDVIRSADILMGGKRHLDQFGDLPMRKWTVTARIDEAMAFIREQRENARIVVLASGDPLFYGIGARIARGAGSRPGGHPPQYHLHCRRICPHRPPLERCGGGQSARQEPQVPPAGRSKTQ